MVGVRILVALVLAAFAALATCRGVDAVQDNRELATWRPVPAIIESASIATVLEKVDSRRTKRRYEAVVQYRYVVDGNTYTGDRYGDERWIFERSAERAIKYLVPGREVTCYVHPTNPLVSMLHNDGTWMDVGSFAFAAVCLAAIWLVAGAPGWTRLRRRLRPSSARPPAPAARARRRGR